MRNLRYLFILAMTAMWALTSCSGDKPENDSVPVNGYTVSFSLRNAAITRTTNAGYDREKAVSNIYAVAFKADDGSYFDTFTLNESAGTYTFDMGQAGAYYLYVVANTTITDFATKDYADEAAFLADVESADPGAGLAASTNFLMLSGRTLADIDGDAVTNLGAIQMERAAARIDIDASAISGIEITKVVVKNRYTSTKLARMGTDVSMTGLTKEAAKQYVRGTGDGQVDAISNTTALVDDDQWQGVIYAYENCASGTDQDEITVVEITHTLGGVESVTSVPFDNIPLKRNYLYTVTLTTPDPVNVQAISANIKVIDWDEATALKFSTLSDNAKPSFTVTSAHSTNQTTNPTIVRAKRTENNTITLTVTSGGAMGSDLTYQGGHVNGDDDYTLADYTTANSAASPIALTSTTYDATGHIVQTYTISVPQALAQSMVSTDYLRFHVSNQFDDTQYQAFEVKSGYAMTFTVAGGSVYNHGAAIEPVVSSITVTDDSNNQHSILNSICTIEYSDNTAAGTGSVTVTVNSGDYQGSSNTQTFEIAKATPTLTLSTSAVSVKPNESTSVTATLGNATAYTGTEFTVAGQDATYVTIPSTASISSGSASISITGVADTPSNETITVTAAADDNYNAVSQTFTLTVLTDPGITLASATVGMIVASNGKAYTTSNFSSTYGTAVAVVGYKNGSSGYAIALVNSTSQTWNEITNSGANKNTDCTLADGKRGSVPVAPTGTTWKILTKDNYSKLFQSMGSTVTSNSSYYYDSNVNSKITVSVGGSALGTALSGSYWSTSEFSGDYGWGFSDSLWYGNSKTSSISVRPVLAW